MGSREDFRLPRQAFGNHVIFGRHFRSKPFTGLPAGNARTTMKWGRTVSFVTHGEEITQSTRTIVHYDRLWSSSYPLFGSLVWGWGRLFFNPSSLSIFFGKSQNASSLSLIQTLAEASSAGKVR